MLANCKESTKMSSPKGRNITSLFLYLRVATIILSVLGFVLSYYAYHVETTKEANKSYRAMCDISEHMSCSAVFTSRYGTGFGFVGAIFGKSSILNQPNSIYGLIFYVVFPLLGEIQSLTVAKVLVALAAVSNVGSVYLAYILYFILYDFCVVCVSTYVVNAGLLICSMYKLKLLTKIGKKKDA